MAQWMDMLKENEYAVSGSQKKKKAYVSLKQREELLKFVLDNPELVTHSSTKENEVTLQSFIGIFLNFGNANLIKRRLTFQQELWNNVTEQLNALLPEKSVVFWKDFFKRWVTMLDTKNENSLTMIDYRLKNFLKNINANNENVDKVNNQKPSNRRKLSIEEIHNNLKEIEAEKTKLKIDIDSMQYAIVKYNVRITELKKNISLKKRKCDQLSMKKTILNNKRRKIEKNENLNKD